MKNNRLNKFSGNGLGDGTGSGCGIASYACFWIFSGFVDRSGYGLGEGNIYGDGYGNGKSNGKGNEEFDGCEDIDGYIYNDKYGRLYFNI